MFIKQYVVFQSTCFHHLSLCMCISEWGEVPAERRAEKGSMKLSMCWGGWGPWPVRVSSVSQSRGGLTGV